MASFRIPAWDYRFEIAPDRWVYVPCTETKEYGLQIKEAVASAWKPPPYFYHLRRGGHVAALQSHWSHKYFAKADINNFFSRVTKSRVTRHVTGLGFGYTRSREMTVMSVVPNTPGTFSVPYGFPQSSILASLCLHKSKLGRFLKNLPTDITVSVYVDDIIISSDAAKSYVADIFESLKACALEAGFPFGDAKLTPPATNVSAFNVSLERGRLTLEQEKYREFHERIVEEGGIEDSARLAILAYADSINIDQGHWLSALPYKPKGKPAPSGTA